VRREDDESAVRRGTEVKMTGEGHGKGGDSWLLVGKKRRWGWGPWRREKGAGLSQGDAAVFDTAGEKKRKAEVVGRWPARARRWLRLLFAMREREGYRELAS
jgi:hypothetical protein